MAAGVGMVHRHFMLLDGMSVTGNVRLGLGPSGLRAAGLRPGQAAAAIRHASARYGLELDPETVVGRLPFGRRQRVEILKVLMRGALPSLAAIPVAGPLLFHQQPPTYVGFTTFMPLAWFLSGTHAGLRLRAVGVVGRWQSAATLAACLVFAAAGALELRVEQFGLTFSSYSVEMLPYLIAVPVLAAFGRSGCMPAALGHRYHHDTAV